MYVHSFLIYCNSTYPCAVVVGLYDCSVPLSGTFGTVHFHPIADEYRGCCQEDTLAILLFEPTPHCLSYHLFILSRRLYCYIVVLELKDEEIYTALFIKNIEQDYYQKETDCVMHHEASWVYCEKLGSCICAMYCRYEHYTPYLVLAGHTILTMYILRFKVLKPSKIPIFFPQFLSLYLYGMI